MKFCSKYFIQKLKIINSYYYALDCFINSKTNFISFAEWIKKYFYLFKASYYLEKRNLHKKHYSKIIRLGLMDLKKCLKNDFLII
tara:strand:- start:359 stop:613 length:255 start_codon:yes stop_codon:yes gene_type:complete